MELFAQAVGIAAMLCSVISFQMKTAKRILIVQTVTVLVFCIHYALLGVVDGVILNTGAVLNGTAVLRNLVFHGVGKKYPKCIAHIIVFEIIYIILGVYFWEGPMSLLSMGALAINSLALAAKTPLNMRRLILVSSPFMFSYALCKGSVGGVANELITDVSIVFALIKAKKGEQTTKA